MIFKNYSKCVFCNSKKLRQEKKQYIKKKFYLEAIMNDLNISEYIFVTSDSVSMLSDALSSGKKIYIVPIKKIKTKIKNFTKIILKKKMAKLFNGKLENWKYKKLLETNKVCKKLANILEL